MVLGAGVAVFLRIIFTGIVVTLMNLPYLKLVGGLALLVIAAKLLVPEDEDEGDVHAAAHLWAAVQIVAIADIVMSLDNVIAVAAAANGSIPLLVLGLAISVPLIVAGAALIMALLTRLPALVWAGAGLLGWIAGEVMATDPAVQPALHAFFNGPVGTGLDGLLKSLDLAQTQAARRRALRYRVGISAQPRGEDSRPWRRWRPGICLIIPVKCSVQARLVAGSCSTGSRSCPCTGTFSKVLTSYCTKSAREKCHDG
jgi:YjbE family integral membrane protein